MYVAELLHAALLFAGLAVHENPSLRCYRDGLLESKSRTAPFVRGSAEDSAEEAENSGSLKGNPMPIRPVE